MKYWLKSFGTADQPLDTDWAVDAPGLLRETSARRSMLFKIGDEVIYYAVGHKKVFAHGTVTGECKRDDTYLDWEYVCPVDLDVKIDSLDDAPLLKDVSLERPLTLSVRRQPYIALSQAEHDNIVEHLRKHWSITQLL
jgi:hypothetical protein